MPYVPIILFLLFFFPPRFLFLGGHSPAHNSIFYKPLETPRLHLNEWLLRTYIPAGSVPFSSMVQIFCVHYFYLALYFFFGQFPGRWLFTGAVGSVGLFLPCVRCCSGSHNKRKTVGAMNNQLGAPIPLSTRIHLFSQRVTRPPLSRKKRQKKRLLFHSLLSRVFHILYRDG